MIYLNLLLTFLQIGAFSFGGGYGMISLMREKVLMYGWLTEEELLNMIAVAESTPGPIAVNMATLIGSSQGGILGSLLATLGVVLPSFVIILIIAALIRNLLKYPPVSAFITGMRPALAGLITAVAVTMGLSALFGLDSLRNVSFAFDWRKMIVLAVAVAVPLIWKHFKKKEFSSVLLILISGVLGAVLF